ncbi:hypothetical protein B0T26DRAFT_756516 [Lasiosphaeria miniovina]|uniref:Uncharacterized protein n=1 Tax=Lasiosphaeria miniovina TaxID=1954250 RepID=A0AA40A0Q2_9PEZI|nr:uncharacterized protein B0T26DRAFT_756516 [Lasiosphaeria miniovina]KAK0707128.1 hypothetical protein B0T26DRAFT_756516 [Lasiosphaeria miniovina]
MELAFSSVVDPSLYNSHGLCDGGEVRLHNSHELGDLGSILGQKDWSESVEPCQYYAGTMSARFNVVSVGFPGCIPDQLEMVSYGAEIGFLADDLAVLANDLAKYGDEPKHTEVLGNMIDTFRPGGQRSSQSSRASGKKGVLVKPSHRILSIDRERAVKAEIIKYWNELQRNIEKAREAGCYSAELLRFLESMKYLHTGGLVGSTRRPRYNAAEDFSPRQREWTKNGIPSEVCQRGARNVCLEQDAAPSTTEPLAPERRLHSDETEADGSAGTRRILNGQEDDTVDELEVMVEMIKA